MTESFQKETAPRRRALSCIQPTGIPTLGNYLGAFRNWTAMQDEFDCAFAVADLHAITVRQDPAQLNRRITEMFALLLAVGLDPEKNLIFVQSQVPEHAQLAWILSCFTRFGELSRMTQFKDKSAGNSDNVNLGLFAYPALMAADILLYRPHYVPVGADQKQHCELTRDVAVRFNNLYGSVFTVPEPYIMKTGARVASLQDPTKKMSKSDANRNATVSMLDDKDAVIRKFKRAVTDGEARVYRDPVKKPGVSNLMDIYSSVTGKTDGEIEKEFDGKGYGEFKIAVGEAVYAALAPIRERYETVMQDGSALKRLMKTGAEKASAVASRTLRDVMEKVGFVLN